MSQKMLCSWCGQVVDPEGHRWECPVKEKPTMSDPVTTLAERLADEGAMQIPTQENGFVVVNWERIAREALAFAREQIGDVVADLARESTRDDHRHKLRDLRRRLGEQDE